jgi:hypothetical protein
MRTIAEMRTSPTWAERDRFNAYAIRLGRLTTDMPRVEPDAVMSRAVQVAKTWRSDLGWRLYAALGLRRGNHV